MTHKTQVNFTAADCLTVNPSELSDVTAKAISGALQSAGIVNASQFQSGASSTPAGTSKVFEKATRTEIEDPTKSVSYGRLKL